MRILYVSQYFPPEVNAPAQRVMDFAKAWREAGHDVTVLTAFPNHPAGVIYDGYRLRLLQRETVDGIKVVRTYVYPAPNKGAFLRCINYASFMVSAATVGAIAAGKADIVIATSPQLLVGAAGYVISRLNRSPFVLEVRDVWPEALAAVHARLSGAPYALLAGMAKFLYKRAAKIVTVTHGAQETIKKHGVKEDKLELIPSGICSDMTRPVPPPGDIRRSFGDGDQIIVSYVGTHGMAQKLSTVLEAAQLLSREPRIRFLLVGDGADKEELLQQKETLGLRNVHFFDQVPTNDALRYIAASDICVVPLRKAELFRQTIPSKMYEIMACGRPMVLAVDGEARELMQNASAGLFVDPENPAALAAAILRLADDPAARSRYGENGRKYIVENFDKGRLSRQYLDLLTRLARSAS